MVTLRTEEEIINLWGENIKKPLVSICCTTYNHEQYVEDTIKGFLMQKTNFPFEVLIHDDSSTDSTQSIIRKYASQFPNIIKPIYQVENKYSQGVRVNFTYNYSRAKGKYIALCEGDDFWINQNKLQNQVDILEQNLEILLCVHASRVLRNLKDRTETTSIKLNDGDKIISNNEIILGGGDYGHTSSFIFHKTLVVNPPTWFKTYPSGDTPIRLLAGYKGQVYYIDKEMSVYRQGVNGSWTSRMNNNDYFVSHWKKALDLFEEYDTYTNHVYSNSIKKRKSTIAYSILDKMDTNQDNLEMYERLLIGKEKFKYKIKNSFPYLFIILKKVGGRKIQ